LLKKKMVFVLNKLDDFKSAEDSIATSIAGVRKDLCGFGYNNPVICQISAYFALLIKLKMNGEQLDEEEQGMFGLFTKKIQ